MKSTEFCKKHEACSEFRFWAVSHTETMMEVWKTARPDWLVWVATREGVLPDKDLRLFAVSCARRFDHLLTDDRLRNAIEVAERFAHGAATKDELAAAYASADSAAIAVKDVAASHAAFSATAAASRSDKASSAAWYSAYFAREAAWGPAHLADEELVSQAAWFRENTTPNFD